LQAKLDRAAADLQSGTDEYVQQLHSGGYLTHEEVGARLKKMFLP